MIFQRQEVALFSFVYNMIHYHIQLIFFILIFITLQARAPRGFKIGGGGQFILLKFCFHFMLLKASTIELLGLFFFV